MSRLFHLALSSQIVGAVFAWSAAAAPLAYETVLAPTPISNITKTTLTGDGTVVATLSGGTLTITGTFQGLSGSATDAHVMMGESIGIPGEPILDISASAAASGMLKGSFKLTAAQTAALRAGRLYIQVNSEKGPAPDGNLWGWLLPEHIKAGQDEPQMGEWYLPQGEGLRTAHGGKNS